MSNSNKSKADSPIGLSAEESDRLFRIARRGATETTPVGAVFDSLAARAAVVGTFTPGELIDGFDDSTEVSEALQQVLEKSAVVTADRQRKWILQPSTREAILDKLGESAVRILDTFRVELQDPLSLMLGQLLRGSTPQAETLPASSLRTLVNAARWAARASGIARKMLAIWQRQLQRRELLEPLQNLVGSHFTGRARELKMLRDYVDIVPPTGIFDGWSRWLSNALMSRPDRPVLMCGVGGIGKSTLVAQFILEHAAVSGERAFPFVYLDFDRSVLDPMNGLSMLAEAAHQLQAQFPVAAEALATFQASLRDRRASSQAEQRGASVLLSSHGNVPDQRDVTEASRGLVDLLAAQGLGERPFLLVLDTFEEVQAKGESAVESVFDWIEALSARRRIKTIIAGRAPLPDRKLAKTIALADLDRRSALRFLIAQGIGSPLARDVFDHVGGNPLSLQLALRLLNQGDRSVSLWTHDSAGSLMRELDQVTMQGYLQTRLLAHIHDERVQVLVHPGLILRRITPDIIREVLGPVVGLTIASTTDADALYEALRKEVSLVVQEGDALVHLKEPRSVMLPLQKVKSPDLFKRLNEAAVRYYGGRDHLQDKVEQTYHRLMLGEDPYHVLRGLSLEAVRKLGSATEDFPPEASLVVRLLLARPLTKEEARTLPDCAWEMYAFLNAVRLLGTGALGRPLRLLRERPTLADSTLLAYPLALALFRSLEWRDADAALARAALYEPPTERALPFDVFDIPNVDIRARIERGYLLWYRSFDTQAAAEFEAARELSLEEGRDSALRVEALLGMLVVSASRTPNDREAHYKLKASLTHEVMNVPRGEWRKNVATLRRVVVFGCATRNAANAALTLLGLQLRSRDTITDFLSEYENELDSSFVKRLLNQLTDANSNGYDASPARARALASLEREIAARFSSTNSDLAQRATPFIRGKYTAWRIPARTGITSLFSDRSTFSPVINETLPGFRPDLPARLRDLVDDVIEAADHQNCLLQLLHNCKRVAEQQGKQSAILDMLLGAMERYANIVESLPG